MELNEGPQLQPAASFGIGALAGVIEVIIQQPSVTWKNAIQDHRPLSLNPRLLYRGLFINSASMAPINGIQFGVDEYLDKKFSGKLSELGKVGTASVSGAVSGLVAGPAELLMIQQQKTGLGLGSQAHSILMQHGATTLLRGTVPTLVRESIFTGAYLGIIPALKARLETRFPSLFGGNSTAAIASASVAAGVAASVATQPFDSIKTLMQANLSHPAYKSLRSTAAQIVRHDGLGGLWRGLIPRTQRVTCAIFILSQAKEHLTLLYFRVVPASTPNVVMALERDTP